MTKQIKLTTRGRYAVMAMANLARSAPDKPLPLSEISQVGGISLSYLEQLVAGLRRHGLVKSYRGPGGGYMLARAAEDILISDILLAAEDSTPAKRNENKGEKDLKYPYADALWEHLGGILYALLRHVSLKDVLDKRYRDHPETRKLFEILG